MKVPIPILSHYKLCVCALIFNNFAIAVSVSNLSRVLSNNQIQIQLYSQTLTPVLKPLCRCCSLRTVFLAQILLSPEGYVQIDILLLDFKKLFLPGILAS